MDKSRRKSRLSQVKQVELIKYFVAGSTARSAAVLAGVNRNTAILYFQKLREEIASRLEQETPELMCGEIELDESYFGGVRKGKRGRGAGGKTPVFGLLKRNGKVHAFPIPNARTETLLPIIRQSIKPDSIVYTDSFSAYDVLDVSEFHHERINYSKTFVDDRNHINGIEDFWSQAKRHMRRFNGIPKEHFHLYLKECEWRFNYRLTQNLIKVLLSWVK
ncbi:IS1595 family transposase [Bartonella sp. HY761]|uniref:IS1595 family transposase n=1 Tax=Bartonella sp. HY761 TaxID=2979330 RepID=UPI0021FA91F2|nr:IS1595 family transposase [Bartonella sp. HY761]UXN05425.1 IS1595 family transposase [Bartonella sp. HY761]